MEPASFPDDCLPAEGEYESRDSLFKAINTWAQPKGYAFTTGKSTKEKSGRQTVTYSCDRCCQRPSAFRERRRKTTTRGTGCQFSVLAKESLDKTVWTSALQIPNEQSAKARVLSTHLPINWIKKGSGVEYNLIQMGYSCFIRPPRFTGIPSGLPRYPLDWSKAEDDRVEALVAQERENEPFDTGRRGVGDIWRRVERDIEEQRAAYLAENTEE